MTEAELMEGVRGLCRFHGYPVFHVRDSRGAWGPGYPDLTICGQRGVIFRECKSASGMLRPDQRAWGRALTSAGADWAVWRPADWHLGRIAGELAALRETPVLSPTAG